MTLRLTYLILGFTLCLTVESAAQCAACEYLTENLVENGDFEQGNIGFTTEYTLATVSGPWGLLSYESTYVIGSDANDYHSFFAGYDHTNPPFGDYMIVNGSSTANTEVWCQNIEVEPNHWYSFSAWVRNVDTNPDNDIYANLQFFVDGVPLGPAADVSGFWQNLAEDWYSGTASSIEICLINQQTNAGGNDFGVDDITFTTCLPYEVLNAPNAGLDQVMCSGETIQLGEEAIGNFEYNWLNTDGLNSTDVADPALTLINTSGNPEIYTYVLETDTAGLGCIQTDTVEVTVNPLPEIDLGPDQILCEGETITLEASGNFDVIEWSDAETSVSIEVSETGVYSATGEALGCTSTDNVEVLTPPLPSFSLGPDTSICEGGIFTFSGPETGMWSTGEEAAFVQIENQGWVWLEYENMGCTARDSVYLEVIPYPVVNLGEDFDLCPGDMVTLFAGQEGAWSTGVVSDSIVVSFPNTYSVVVSNAQCSAFDDVEVGAIAFPQVELGDNRLLCLGERVDLSAFAEQNEEVLWTTGQTEPEIAVYDSGIYGVAVSNQCATVEDEVEIIFEDCNYGLYIPNVFTPDGDGLNDAWKVEGYNLKTYELILFDRWGNEVWRSTDLSDFWTGNVQGGSYYASDGLYYYRVVATSNKNVLINRFGWVNMLR